MHYDIIRLVLLPVVDMSSELPSSDELLIVIVAVDVILRGEFSRFILAEFVS